MAKKGTKIALTYFITIIVSILLIGGVAIFLFSRATHQGPSVADIEVTSSTESPDDEYVPSMLDNQTTLFILDAEDRMSGSVFVLTRMLPSQAKVIIVPLQSDTVVTLNGEEKTLYDHYLTGGVSYARRAVETLCDVSVDKYMKFDKFTFENFAAHFATINYNVPYNLIYENEATGETTVLREGGQAMDPTSMRKIFTFPEFSNGETSRNSVVGTIVTEFLNASKDTRFATGMDPIVETVLQSGVDTDITIYDYEFKKDAMQYTIENCGQLAELVMPTGEYDENGAYRLDPNFIKALKSWFAVDMYSFEASESTDATSEYEELE